MKYAIIGTAGRDKTKPMTMALWYWMLQDSKRRIPRGAHVVSGGAAWADHLAVALYLEGVASQITLHLPAPFKDGQFIGPHKSAGSAANYYHDLFWQATGVDGLHQIAMIEHMPGVIGTFEPAMEGYSAMFARNKKVALADCMLAYTFGEGDVPADGGTKNTWDQCKGKKVHVTLPIME